MINKEWIKNKTIIKKTLVSKKKTKAVNRATNRLKVTSFVEKKRFKGYFYCNLFLIPKIFCEEHILLLN